MVETQIGYQLQNSRLVAWWVFVLSNTNKLEGVCGRDYRGAGLVESAVVLGVDAEETAGGADTVTARATI